MTRFKLLSVALGMFLVSSACHSTADTSSAPGSTPAASSAPSASEWWIGAYPLSGSPVIDGDTIRVEGLGAKVRLLGLDTEETFHSKADREQAARDFEAYLQQKRGNRPRPQKAATPMGEEAKDWAQSFFEGVNRVELERDAAHEKQDRYGRELAHLFAYKNGKRVHYNAAAIRAGMTPYFIKYGYSERFHETFERAEAEARAAQRGIWDPGKQAYRDYPERKAWWTARADCIERFAREARTRPGHIVLTHADADAQLEGQVGHEVRILGAVQRIDPKKSLVRVWLGKREGSDFPLIFFDRDVYHRSGLRKYRGELVTVRGKIERYEAGQYRTLQIVVKSDSQIEPCPLPEPGTSQTK